MRHQVSHFTVERGFNLGNYPATLFSESGSDIFFCFHSYPDCAKDPNMVVARHIKDPLAIHSKAEMTNAVVTLLDQVANP